ncbi:MAG: class I SAM-dependent methyltransferase [Lachnospiraceae bacterium]|nr:class I SAM-dependent methyltransferase [Lachnospiraceae bacterium]
MAEQIGKIKLDYSRYPGEDYYCDGVIEQEILEIAKKYSPMEFPGIIEERKSWPVLYHLSELRENIVEWLPIDKSMKVLEVGSGCGAITGALAKKAGEVTCIDLSKQRSLINAHRHSQDDNVTIRVGNFRDIEPDLPCDYDYVCLIGVFEYAISYMGGETPFEDFYKILKKHVKKGGKLVIAIENKFGLKYWAGCREDHLGTFFSSLEDYPQGGGVRTFSRQGLEKIIQACGDQEYSFYYPYPDYKFMTTLYSDDRLPRVGELSDNKRNFDRDRLQLFDEKNVFDALIQEEMFPFYSNSYMVVIGEKPQTIYCRYSNDRAPATAIKTEIVEKKGKKVVRKCALTPYGGEHIRHIHTSYEKLKERYKKSKLKINKCRLFEGELPYVELEYVEGVTLTALLDERLNRGDEEGFWQLFEEYVSRISHNETMSIADYDMIFANIIIRDETWTVIDYEWTREQMVETKEIAFRSLYCYLLENEKRNKLDMSYAFELLNITPREQDEFREKEMEFQRRVLGKRRSMAEIRELIGERIFQPLNMLDSMHNSEGKDKVQIYLDAGTGYSEENSYFVPDPFVGEEELEFTLTVPGNVKNLRIDPAMESCVVKIREFTFNGEAIPYQNKRAVTINGSKAVNTMVFTTQDPNINLHLENFQMKSSNIIFMKLKVKRMETEICEELEKELKRKIRL